MRGMLGRRDRKSNVIVPWIGDRGGDCKERERQCGNLDEEVSVDKRVIKHFGLVFRDVMTYL